MTRKLPAEALLEKPCAPAILELERLIDTGRLFRKEIARLELSYAKEQQNLTRVVGDFALPTQSAGLVDGISFKYFTVYAQLLDETREAGFLGPLQLPPGAGSALPQLANAFLHPSPAVNNKAVQAAGKLLFFDAKDQAASDKATADAKVYLDKFEELRLAYEASRAALNETYSPETIAALNRFYFSTGLQRLESARKKYGEVKDQVRELALGRSLEHCLGALEAEILKSLILGGGDPFFQKGEDNTVGGLPGMGFIQTAEARIKPFKASVIPAFGYRFNVKRSALGLANALADVNINKGMSNLAELEDYAFFLRDTSFEAAEIAANLTVEAIGDKIGQMVEGFDRLVGTFINGGFRKEGEAAVDYLVETSAEEIGEDINKAYIAVDQALHDHFVKTLKGNIAHEELAQAGLIDNGNALTDQAEIFKYFDALSPDQRRLSS